MDVETFSVVVMVVGLIAVDGKHRKKCDQLQALSEYIGKGSVVCSVVVGVERQYTSGQRIHHIVAGRFHNDVSHKTGRQRTVAVQEFCKISQLFTIRQSVK